MVVDMGIKILGIQFKYQDRKKTLNNRVIEHWIVKQIKWNKTETELEMMIEQKQLM
jgi:hypothetical protein